MTVVYWLHNDDCHDPATDGYVGLTCRLKRRLRDHKVAGCFPTFTHTILFEGTRAACAAFEQHLRPVGGIGWNKQAGGFGGRIACASTRVKQSLAAKRARPSHPLALQHQVKLDTLAKLQSIRRLLAIKKAQ